MSIIERLLIMPVLAGFLIIVVVGGVLPAAAKDPPTHLNCGETDRVLELTTPPLTGLDVLEAQQRLEELGYPIGDPPGVYGTSTTAAVMKFQKTHRLLPSGKVEPLTWHALGAGTEPAAAPSPKAPEGTISLVLDIDKRTLTILADGKVFKTYPIAVGTKDTPSPIGEWKIVHKGYDWGGGFGTRWLGLNVPWGIYGIHGTNKPWSIGRSASHGCFRMHNRHVEEIFPWIPIGARVVVTGSRTIKNPRVIKAGVSGQDVVLVQMKLQEMGLYWGFADGRFGRGTEMAVKYFQTLSALEPDGVVRGEVYRKLGLQ